MLTGFQCEPYSRFYCCFHPAKHLNHTGFMHALIFSMRTTSQVAALITSQTPLVPPAIPSADQMAEWSAPQFIQVCLGFAMLAMFAIAVFFIRQMKENSKELNSQNDSLFKELVRRYDRQEERYEQQDLRHRDRDEKTIEALRNGLADMAAAVRELAKEQH